MTGCLFLISRNLDNFLKIRDGFLRLFPTVKTFSLKNIKINGKIAKVLEFELKSGDRVPAQFLSEGVLYYLAFSALQYLEPASIVLIEEPENGLHPSRIKEIMDVLRNISETTQVILATHSPLVVNEMNPDEVTVVWRDDDKGTQVRPLQDTENARQEL